jgi:hypothetical protein
VTADQPMSNRTLATYRSPSLSDAFSYYAADGLQAYIVHEVRKSRPDFLGRVFAGVGLIALEAWKTKVNSPIRPRFRSVFLDAVRDTSPPALPRKAVNKRRRRAKKSVNVHDAEYVIN